MSYRDKFRHRPAPCPCEDVNHNWTQDQRHDLARRLDAAERYGLHHSASILRRRLLPCPAAWRHIP